jgi:hypothetical protein
VRDVNTPRQRASNDGRAGFRVSIGSAGPVVIDNHLAATVTAFVHIYIPDSELERLLAEAKLKAGRSGAHR